MSKKHCRMLQVECCFDKVKCCFDVVAVLGDNVEATFDIVAKKQQHRRSNSQQSCQLLQRCCFDIVSDVDRALEMSREVSRTNRSIFMFTLLYLLTHKLEMDFDAPASTWIPCATSTACCEIDLWPLKSKQVIGRGYWIFPVSFIEIGQAVHEISW